MRLNCAGKFGKIFLIVLNIVFMLLGLALIIPGVLVHVNVDFVSEKVLPLMSTLTFGGISLAGAAQGLSIALIIVGTFLFLIAFIGILGACCGWRMALIIYAVVVLVLWVAQLVIVCLYITMKEKINTEVQEQMLAQLHDNYIADELTSINTTTSSKISTAWNYLFIQLKCCGVHPVSLLSNDFDNTQWRKDNPLITAKIPKSCCGATETNYLVFSNPQCTDSLVTGYYENGCFNTIYNLIASYNIAFIAVGVITLLVQGVAIASACMIYRQLTSHSQFA
ncbi:tetraspanin-9-like [Mizuhopecten yessoensis]|uniref:Tetraspanin n=1 Tax=Mizuhopecten yessoensis TaxID=6573 RepID=A0A210QUJ9_MIZYE|nr:tetraspanin-9-like [Mizuhopecten yessoensis]OWF52420.1 Tetraspanin-1 [Mizuhopecten yessoensis]